MKRLQFRNRPPFFLAIFLVSFLIVPSTMAVNLGDMPVTAEFSAGLRAVAAMDPDEKIRNPDTLARKFLSPSFWFWTALDEEYEKSKKFILPSG